MNTNKNTTYKKTTLLIVFLLIVSFFASNSVLAASARQYYYSELITPHSTNSTSYQDALSLSFTPDDNATYLIISSWTHKGNNYGYPVKSKLARTTGTAKDFNELMHYFKDPSVDVYPVGTIGIDSFGTNPGSQTYKIQHASGYIAYTSYISYNDTQSSIIALKLSSLDYYAQSEARTTTTSTSFVDKTTLTFTPATAGDYIILASATVDGSSASYDYKAQLNIDGTGYNTSNIETVNVADKNSWIMMKKVNLTATSHTIKIQYAGESSNKITVGMAHARIVALRADEFLENHYLESENRQTSTGVIDKSLTPTTQSGEYLVIGSLNSDSSTTSTVACVSLIEYISSNPQHMCYVAKDASSRGFSSFSVLKRTLIPVSQNWHLMTNGVGITTVGMQNARMIAIELVPVVINGSCGTADTYGYPSTSEIDTAEEKCAAGGFTSFTDAGATWTWSCAGFSGGTTANCSASKAICGTSDNKTYATEPLGNLCAYGSESSRTLTNNVWTWTCSNNPGVNDSCSTNKTTCGSSHGGSFLIAPSTNLCAFGEASSVSGSGPWTWTCTGDDSIAVNCSASKIETEISVLKDIYAGSSNSLPQKLTVSNSILYFQAYTVANGVELWRSGGTEVGTYMVKDINPGASNSSLYSLADYNNILYFRATDGTNGVELWRSDGTEVGTYMVKDIYAGTFGSSPTNLTVYNNILYFSAGTATSGSELWRSDGTEVGTYMVKEINPGSLSSSPNSLKVYNNILYFEATDGTNGVELWRSDGTEVGTYMVKDIRSGSADSYPASDLTVCNNIMYFSPDDGTNGLELWRSDGTEVGTYMVKDIYAGASSSGPSNFIAYNNILYFAADNGTSGNELWRSDGTEVGTYMVKDISPEATNSSPSYLTVSNNILYFQAYTVANGLELWRSDGTEVGTYMVKDISPEATNSSPSYLIDYNNILYFRASDATSGANRLWRSDGTAIGTYVVDDYFTMNDQIAVYDNKLFLSITASEIGSELGYYESTVDGVCGSAHGQSFYAPPAENLCSSGTPSSVTVNALTFTWDCVGDTTASCSANQLTRPFICGIYGDADSSGFINYYDSNYLFYNYETMPAERGDLSGNGTVGFGDITNLINYVEEGLASYMPVCNGICGTADGQSFESAPTENLCSRGSASELFGTGPWAWNCNVSASFPKRKAITLTNSGSALTDYQVKVDVTYDSDMQADFDDIRFRASDGTTELNYWLESKTDSTSAVFWVKVPSIPNGSSTIYIYYGNSSVVSVSNGDNTFLLFDDFSGTSLDANKWTITKQMGTGTITVSGGTLTLNAPGGATNHVAIESNYSFTESVKTKARINFYNITSQERNRGLFSFYGVPGDAGVFDLGTSILKEYFVGSSYNTITAGQWYDSTGVIHPNSAGTSSWTLVGTRTWTTSATPCKVFASVGDDAGSIGGKSEYDYIFIYKYASAEPTSSFGTEEAVASAGTPDSCSAELTGGGPTAITIKSPTNIDSNESCWYCTHYLSGVNIVSGNSGNLQFKFTYSDSNPSALITAYDFAIGTDPDVNNALITINDIPVPSQAVGTEITLSSTISVKPNPSAMLNQIGYGEIYHWWIRPTNNAAQTSAWIEASTTFATPSHAFPLVRIVPKVAKLVLNQSTTVCTTIDNDGDVTDDPCYTTCWTPGTGAPDLESSNWKCSVCYDPTTNLPIYCSTDNTTPNAFTWSIIEGTGTLSALDAENPILTYTAKSEELRTRLIITGSECGGEQGEGEGVGGTMPIPKWKEVAK